MFQQVIDFRDESRALYELMKPLAAEAYSTRTQFKQWKFNDILGHLHFWNRAAELSFNDEAAFQAMIEEVFQYVASGNLRDFESQWPGRSQRNGIAGNLACFCFGDVRQLW